MTCAGSARIRNVRGSGGRQFSSAQTLRVFPAVWPASALRPTGEGSFQGVEHVLDRKWLTPKPAAPGMTLFLRGLVSRQDRIGVDHERGCRCSTIAGSGSIFFKYLKQST